MPRVGLDRIKAVVVEDSEGIAERLDAAVQEHADSYVDPWTQQAAELNHPGFGGGIDPTKGWSHVSTEEVSA